MQKLRVIVIKICFILQTTYRQNGSLVMLERLLNKFSNQLVFVL